MRRQDRWFGKSFSPEAGFDFAKRFLAERPERRPSAVVLGNDVMALGFLRAVSQCGVKIPDHVSVVGFDGTPDGGLSWPGLTTVVQPTRTMARDVCHALLQIIGQRTQGRATVIDYDIELLVRESTAAPR